MIISDSGISFKSCNDLRTLTPKPSYPNFVFFHTHGNETPPTFNDSFKSLIDLKNLKFDVGIASWTKKSF